MKKAVSKRLQVDAPETELPPFRYLNRFTNNLVSMANNHQRYGQSHNNEDEVVKMMKMMMMMKMMKSFGQDEDHHSSRHGCNGYHDCDDSYSSQPEKNDENDDEINDGLRESRQNGLNGHGQYGCVLQDVQPNDEEIHGWIPEETGR